MNLKEEILQLSNEVANQINLSVFQINFLGSKNMVLQIMIEKENLEPVTSDDCAHFSRKLANILDEKDIIGSAYTLEVSSPGVNRDLLGIEDYKRFSGKPVKIVCIDQVLTPEGHLSGKLKGKIVSVSDEELLLLTNEEVEITISLNNIKKANLDII